jgi:serine/threonine protein kinase
MGEVYRAKDHKLKREVAIKSLPENFARDPQRITRFQQEAEVLASLNRQGAARALEEFAGFAASCAEAERALRPAGAASVIRHRSSAQYLKDRPSLVRKLDSARQTVGDAALEYEMNGWAISMEAAIQYALNKDRETA